MHTEEDYVTLSAFHQIYKTQNKIWYKSTFYTYVYQILRKICSSDTAADRDYSPMSYENV